jgi:predicted PurR-regulated permease PerM
MSQRRQRIILGLLLTVLALLLVGIAWPFVSALVLASMLAVVLHPANSRLSRRLRRPGLSSLLVTLATLVIVGTTVAFVCVTAVRSTRNAYKAIHQHSLGQDAGPPTLIRITDEIVDALATRLPMEKEVIRARVITAIENGARYLLSKMQGAIESITSILVTSVLAIIFVYYFLRYGEQWLTHLTSLVPLTPDITANLLRTAHHSIVANVNGLLVVGLAQGLFLSMGFRFVGIGSPLQWGVFGAIASLVPFAGITLIWAPAVLSLVLAGSYGKALVLGLWCGLVVASLDNILRPLVVGAREKQNPVLVGFAMLGGTYAIGPLGLLFGPLVVSLTGAVLEEIRRMGPPSSEVDTPVRAIVDPIPASASAEGFEGYSEPAKASDSGRV